MKIPVVPSIQWDFETKNLLGGGVVCCTRVIMVTLSFLLRTERLFFDFVQIYFGEKLKQFHCTGTQCANHNYGNLKKLQRHITSKHTKVSTAPRNTHQRMVVAKPGQGACLCQKSTKLRRRPRDFRQFPLADQTGTRTMLSRCGSALGACVYFVRQKGQNLCCFHGCMFTWMIVNNPEPATSPCPCLCVAQLGLCVFRVPEMGQNLM